MTLTPEDMRKAGMTEEALKYPRSERQCAMFAAFLGVEPHQLPETHRYFANESMKRMWERLEAAALSQADIIVSKGDPKAEISVLIRKGEGGNFQVSMERGSFLCKAEQAFAESEMLNCAEDAIQRSPSDAMEIGCVLLDYLQGRSSIERVIGVLNEDRGNSNEAR